jgi:ABC-type sugar transport system permease subunit
MTPREPDIAAFQTALAKAVTTALEDAAAREREEASRNSAATACKEDIQKIRVELKEFTDAFHEGHFELVQTLGGINQRLHQGDENFKTFASSLQELQLDKVRRDAVAEALAKNEDKETKKEPTLWKSVQNTALTVVITLLVGAVVAWIINGGLTDHGAHPVTPPSATP